jgi:hypothetical protein
MCAVVRLRIPAEIRDWIAELHARDLRTALAVDEALVALIEDGAALGLPLLADLSAPLSGDPREALDHAYQLLLDRLTASRRAVADAATAHRRAQAAGDPELAGRAAAAERESAAALQRVQAAVDSVRATKETLKARYTAAEAIRELGGVLADAGPGEAEATRPAGDPLGPVQADIAALLERVRRLDEALGGAPGRPSAAPGLLELRPGAPRNLGVRILAAIEPPGTAVLLAVLDGDEAVAGRRDEAIRAASALLADLRAGREQPAAGGCQAADAAALLAEFLTARPG